MQLRHGALHEAVIAPRPIEEQDHYSLMKVPPPLSDLVSQYIRSVVNHLQPTRIGVWAHAADRIGQIELRARYLIYNQQVLGGFLSRRMGTSLWSEDGLWFSCQAATSNTSGSTFDDL